MNSTDNIIVLEMKGISKAFPGVKALDNMNFCLNKGSVHALLGENGAGKSTLMKILSGIYKADRGDIYIDGEKVYFRNTLDSQQKGISIIHQELNLCWNLSVAENILLNRVPTGLLGYCKRQKMNQKVEKILAGLGMGHLRPDHLVDHLSIANQQMVEIAKAISIDANILIMDEPTSSLTEKEEKMLFKIIKTLQSQGVSIIYISHKLDEIFEICDEVTVIRDGICIQTLSIAETNHNSLIELMVGRSINMIYPCTSKDNLNGTCDEEIVFEVRHIKKRGLVDNVSFQVRKGEILGFSGLIGAGRTEMAKTLFGRWQKDAGTVYLRGEEVQINSTSAAIKHGIAFVPEDRKKEGLNLLASVKDNVLSSNLDLIKSFMGIVNTRKEKFLAEDCVTKLKVKTPSINTLVSNLSGGNQQKLIISRWLTKHIKVLILDEPTRGIDVGAKSEIYELIRILANQGIAVIMISSELPEVLGMSDRIAVMRGGTIVQTLTKEEFSQEKIMYYATGWD